MYNLGNTDLASIGFTAARQDGSDVALSGFLDMPARLGKTFQDWADQDGIEPYVAASEIFFGGRDLKLTGFITGNNQYDYMTKVNSLYSLIDSFTGLVPLVTDWGTFNVGVSAAVTGDYLSDKGIKINIPFREPIVTMNGILPVGTSSEFGIDGVSFSSLGGAFIELSGDRRNRTAPKKMDVTAYGKEGYVVTKKEVPSLTFKLVVKQASYALLKAKIMALMALFSAPGMRNLTVNNDKIRAFFVKDGFTVTNIYAHSSSCYALVECKLTESGVGGTMINLMDSLGNLMTDHSSNQITVRI